MGFFDRKHEIDLSMSQTTGPEAISSLFDRNMVITGAVSFKGKARIDGVIHGDILDGGHLILSETGRITGNIRTLSLNCYGTLEGDIQAGSVIARKTCSIHGRIEIASLTVEPGAAIDGEIRTAAGDHDPAATGEPPPSSSAANHDTDE